MRVAARVQTFPDVRFDSTSQYTQVRNAVLPKLANQIADVVAYSRSHAGLA
jgi:hypothetical protein